MPTVAHLLGRCLAAAGATQVVGRPVEGLALVPVPERSLACLLADADGRLGPGPGVALLDGDVVYLSARPGAAVEPMPLGDPLLLPDAVARAGDWTSNDSPGAAAFRLDLDLEAPAPSGLAPSPPPARPTADLDAVLEAVAVAARPLAFVGPGTVRRGRVDALRRLADVAGLGVSNTWGAKGVFPWDDPHHLGTVGLQADDFTLGGFADADLIVAVGLDPDEAPGDRWRLAPDVAVPPEQLDALAERWPRPLVLASPPPLFERLAAVCQPGYRASGFPLHPGRAIAEIKAALAPGDRVAADPGTVGFWMARAFPTSELGSVVVPATGGSGFAAAAAYVAARRPEPQRVLAVTAQPVDEVTRQILDLARADGTPVVVCAWGADGDLADPAQLGDRIAAARSVGGVHVIEVPVDLTRTEELIAVAGPIVAWGGTG